MQKTFGCALNLFQVPSTSNVLQTRGRFVTSNVKAKKFFQPLKKIPFLFLSTKKGNKTKNNLKNYVCTENSILPREGKIDFSFISVFFAYFVLK